MQTNCDLARLLSTLQPVLHPGRYAFVTLPSGAAVDMDAMVASVREPEGLSVVLAEEDARERGLPVAFVAAWITLAVESDLAAIGLTAAVSTALAQAGIACNMVAGTRHDHLFVPAMQAREAMNVLRALQRAGGA